MNVPALLATYQLRQREYLLRITRAMTSRLDLPSLLKLILSSAAEMVGCRAGLIVLARDPSSAGTPAEGRTYFQIRAVYNIPPQAWPDFEPLLDMVPRVQEERPAAARDGADTDIESDVEAGIGASVESDTAADANDFLDMQARVRQVEERLGFTLGQVVGLPLLFEDELLGVIYLFRSEYAFTQMDWQFLQGFADQAAIAVRNARLYHQLETERSRLATIIENSANGVLILDVQRRVVVINQALTAMLDMSEAGALGRPCHEVLLLTNVMGEDLCQADTVDALAEGVSLRCEGDLVRPGGGRVTVSATYSPLYDEAGHLVNIIVNVHDITRFREEEEMKSTFTSIISHELKTPVALIKGYAQTLARPDAAWDAATARQSLEIIEEEADRLEALINNLLDVSRIQASGLRLDFAEVDLEALARKIAEAYRTQTSTHQIELDFGAPLPLVWGDEERLRQVLTNLLGNAIKYSPDGGVIRIGGWSQRPPELDGQERVVLFVADQGIGIPQEELNHIFERFYRVDSSLRRSTSGAGLGLFLTKAIVEAHGGQIWARSESGRGTTFFIALPVAHPVDVR
ncbi:MAG: GAF domain-containing protein [Caldilineaceae bacterium]|nr:GAF domain-containing protein [Caldilineaceae bacterium]